MVLALASGLSKVRMANPSATSSFNADIAAPPEWGGVRAGYRHTAVGERVATGPSSSRGVIILGALGGMRPRGGGELPMIRQTGATERPAAETKMVLEVDADPVRGAELKAHHERT